MLKKIICIFAALTMLQTAVFAKAVEPIKDFDSVFSEAIGTNIDEIGYGMIFFPSEGIPRAANLEDEDLKKLMDAYSQAEGAALTAHEGLYFSDYNSELISGDKHFYIGVSRELPYERWTWNRTVNMLKLCFGGEYKGAAVYGGYGIVKSTYGDEYPPELPTVFLWYKPVGEMGEKICEIGDELYNKYKPFSKPFGDYEGTYDEQFFSGCDATFETEFRLPECFSAEGCSEWAYDILHKAASGALIPYNTPQSYTEPITRKVFCDLVANMLNFLPYRDYFDYFANPLGYTMLAEQAAAEGVDPDSVSYSDMPQITDSVKYLSALGIVGGIGGDEFDPDGFITREQLCTILDRVVLRYPEINSMLEGVEGREVSYTDAGEISDWAYESVDRISRYGFMQGFENGCFEPKRYCTLEQAIAVIYRLPQPRDIRY